jgi:CRISPR-associated endonuclease Csn1
LQSDEFAVVLVHIAKHRGFRSNSKRDRGANAASETSKMLKAIDATRDKLSKYRTVGEMMAFDPEFSLRKRNREGDFSRTILRSDLDAEVQRLFERQRVLDNSLATRDLEEAYREVAFSQRPLADSWDKVGYCPFEKDEKRTAKHSRSFELFRFLARLTSLRVGDRSYRPLTPDEIAAAVVDFGITKSLKFARLRNVMQISSADRFQGVPLDEETKRDVVTRSGSGAEGTVTLRNCIGTSAWASLLSTPDRLDRIGDLLTFLESPDSMRRELEVLSLDPLVVEAIMAGVNRGDFSKFGGAGHISAKAARNIIPRLMRGLTYDKACAEAGYRHRVETEISNPVARKAVYEALKQVSAVVGEFRRRLNDAAWMPNRIHIELARDIGKSAEERAEIERGIERRNKEKARLRDTEFPEVVGRPCQSSEDLLRFELWREQAGWCLYTGQCIPPHQIVASDNTVQVDHILPWSRFGDDSFHNRTLCLASANQEKRGRTPFEWFESDKTAEEWALFRARVEGCKGIRGMKKRNYLLQSSDEIEGRFRTRNLNDTRYAARALMARLEHKYPPPPGERRVFARPGSLTAKLRRAWGIDDLKRQAGTGKRVDDDRHHALDAIVLAATTESALQRLTRAFKEAERRGLAREFAGFDLPWPSFVEDVRKAFADVFVSRAERRRARGKAHDATIKQVRDMEGDRTVYERKAIEKLTLADLDRIPMPQPHGKVAEPHKLRDATVAALRAWIEAGKPKDAPPRSPRGDAIRKVRIATTDNVAVEVREGTADRGDMVRIDVFQKPNAKGKPQFYLVPIYPHEVATLAAPPKRAVLGGGDDDRWPTVDESYAFLWSIYPMSLVEITKADGKVIRGYHRSLDRNTGALTVSAVNSSSLIRRGIGARTLIGFRKLVVDRLGRTFEVPREKRTWRGEVCT